MWQALPENWLWQHALAAIPLVIIVALVTRFIPCRPATRHSLWVAALFWMILAPFLPQAPSLSLVATTQEPAVEVSVADTRNLTAPISQETASDAHPMALSSSAVIEETIEQRRPRRNELRREREVRNKRSAREPRTTRTRFAGGRRPMAERSDEASPPVTSWPVLEIADAELSLPAAALPDQNSGSGIGLTAVPSSSQRSVARPRSTSEPDAPSRLAQATEFGGPLTLEDPQAADGQAVPSPSFASYDGSWELAQAQPLTEPTPSYLLTGDEMAGTVAPSAGPIVSESLTARLPEIRTWVIGLTAVGSAILNLPPIPVEVWVGGALLITICGMVRILRSRSVIRTAFRAPVAVRQLVAEVAEEMGLRNVPETLFIKHRTSPMVWCGRQLRLVLPVSLWSDLDEEGRRAVIVHELAHLRRRDHWVSWAGLLVGILYWWYPVVWWVRSRVNAEAEHCCDAWVTTLLPKGRRAYAEALLKAKQHVFDSEPLTPAVGIRVTTGQAGRFARRLSMVMTQNVKPRMSMSGVALVASVVLVGWLVSPVRSCPDEKKTTPATVTTVTSAPTVAFGHAHGTSVVATSPCSSRSKAAKPCKDSKPVAVVAGLASADCSHDCGCKKLKAKKAKKSKKAKTSRTRSRTRTTVRSTHSECKGGDCGSCAHGAVGIGSGHIAVVSSGDCCGDCKGCDKAKKKDCCGKGDCCAKGKAKGIGKPAGVIIGQVPSPLGHPRIAPAPKLYAVPAPDGRSEYRFATYGDGDDDENERLRRLEKRLERLGEQIERISGALENGRGKAGEGHRRAREMREGREPRAPKAKRAPKAPRAPKARRAPRAERAESDSGETIVRSYSLPKGKLKALSALMVRSDVPILVSPGDDAIEVHGTAKQHRIFAAFVKAIHPSDDGRSEATTPEAAHMFPGAKMNDQLARELAERAAQMADAAKDARAQYASAMELERNHARVAAVQYERAHKMYELRAKYESLRQEMSMMEEQADALHDQADQIREHADSARSEADNIRSEADDLRSELDQVDSDGARAELKARMNAMLAQAKEMNSQAKKLDREANALDKRAEKLQQKAEKIDRKAEEVESAAEEIDVLDESQEDGDEDEDDEEKGDE